MMEPGYRLKLDKDWAKRICVRCNQRKPIKGGSTKRGASFQCADCRSRVKTSVAAA